MYWTFLITPSTMKLQSSRVLLCQSLEWIQNWIRFLWIFKTHNRICKTIFSKPEIGLTVSRDCFSNFLFRKIEYFGSNKDRFQLQFPESLCQSIGAMPKEFLLKSRKKGFKRFWTPYIQEQFTRLQVLEEKKQTALKNCTATVFSKFYQVEIATLVKSSTMITGGK